MRGAPLTSYTESGRPKYLYTAVMEELKRRLSRMQPGDRLSSERQLAAEFKVDVITIKRSLAELAAIGLVVRCHGRGTFATEKVNSLKKILWVTGPDSRTTHVSRYWSDSLVSAESQFGALGFSIDHLWGVKDAYDFIYKANNANSLEDYLGFVFIGCHSSHPILKKVVDNSILHVVIGDVDMDSPKVICDVMQAHELAFSQLRKKGHSRVSYFSHGPKPSVMPQPLSQKIKFDFIESLGSSGPIELERNSYFSAMRLIAEGKLHSGIFIDDDIVARGVTRAILESRDKVPTNLCIVVRCERHSVVPLGLPVTTVTFDLEDEVRAAVRMLTDQINGIPLKEKLRTIPFRMDEGELEESLRSESLKVESRRTEDIRQTTEMADGARWTASLMSL